MYVCIYMYVCICIYIYIELYRYIAILYRTSTSETGKFPGICNYTGEYMIVPSCLGVPEFTGAFFGGVLQKMSPGQQEEEEGKRT